MKKKKKSKKQIKKKNQHLALLHQGELTDTDERVHFIEKFKAIFE